MVGSRRRPLAEEGPAARGDRGARPRSSPSSHTKVFHGVDGEHRGLVHLRASLWWGHRNPGVPLAAADSSPWRGRRPAECKHCHNPRNRSRIPNILDTWFSSGLWPFPRRSAGPTRPARCRRFYPNNVLVTGPEHHLLLGRPDDDDGPPLPHGGRSRFARSYLTAIVTDENGRQDGGRPRAKT